MNSDVPYKSSIVKGDEFNNHMSKQEAIYILSVSVDGSRMYPMLVVTR